MMVGGVATAAARTYPYRVFSFPKEIVVVKKWRHPIQFVNVNGGPFGLYDPDGGPFGLYDPTRRFMGIQRYNPDGAT